MCVARNAAAVCAAPHTRSQLHSRPEQFGASELALFYRKGLIALPITDNATINDLGEGRGKSREPPCAKRPAGVKRGGGRVPCRPPTSSVYKQSGLYMRNDVCNGASTL
ncbi:hypothetical protein ACS0PU_010093 [Formica fusca]